MRPRITLIVPVVVATLVFVADLAWAETPTERLRTFFTETNAIMREADPKRGTEGSRAMLRALVHDVVDLRAAAVRALGPEWLERTPREQEEFVRLFAGLLERGYVAMLGTEMRTSDGLSINFMGESVRDDSATVTATMLTRVGNTLPVDFRLNRAGTRWAVQDVKIDGVSLVGNYRAQFRRVMQASSYNALVAQMRDKVLDSPRDVTAIEAPPAAAPTATITAPTPAPAPAVVSLAAPIPPTALSDVPIEPAAATRPRSAIKTTPGERLSFWVQLGAFRSADAASRLADRLWPMVANISTTPTGPSAPDRTTLARVRVGPFAQRAQAITKLKELEKSGYRGFIVAEMQDH